MKTLPVLLIVPLLLALSNPAYAHKKKKATKHHTTPASETSETQGEKPEQAGSPAAPEGEEAGATGGAKDSKGALNFDFFGDQAGSKKVAAESGESNAEVDDVEAKAQTRRWMLKTHQTLGIATWLLMASTVIVGQLNYNQLYGGGGGSTKWQTPHRYLVLSTSVAFAATGAFALFAPTPYKKPLHFDTGLVHRIAVIGATLGMLAEGWLGWVATHEADAGNRQSRSMARNHQIIGYTTFGFLTIAGTVWIF